MSSQFDPAAREPRSTQAPTTRSLCGPGGVALLAMAVSGGPLAAQVLAHESLTGPSWTHVHGSPDWTDDVADADSYFGKVDRLEGVRRLEYTTASRVLQPGTYRASFFFKKLASSPARYPLRLSATFDGRTVTAEQPASLQPAGEWRAHEGLVFEIDRVDTEIAFRIHNVDQTDKRGYLFDAFVLGRNEGGTIVKTFGPLGRIPSSGSPYGTVARTDDSTTGVPMGDLRLPKGTYRVALRFRSAVEDNPSGPGLWVTSYRSRTSWTRALADNSGNWATVVRTFTLQQEQDLGIGVYGLTTDRFPDWELAMATVYRVHAYMTFGTGCRGTNGVPQLGSDTLPTLGKPHVVRLDNARPKAAVILHYGLSDRLWGALELPFDLGVIGARGCTRYVDDPIRIARFADANGRATASFSIPNDPDLLGATFYNQWTLRDAAANSLGFTVSNAAVGVIGR